METNNSSIEDPKDKSLPIPSNHDLANYAKAYMGAYGGMIEKEHPENLPPLAKNAPYDMEICLLPNSCFCLLFQKSNKENVIVTERDYEYVEGKISSGLDYLISVYAHEGATMTDAIKKGKKDAISDIRAMETNEIAQASLHLEKIVDELTDVAMANRVSLKSVASQISKLSPIKESVKRGVPHYDMMRTVQPLKNYPPKPIEIRLDIPDRELLERLSSQLASTSEMIKRIEAQEKLIEDLEERINEAYDGLVSKIDEKIDRGLSHVISASDKRLDKGLSDITGKVKVASMDEKRMKEFADQIDELKVAVSAAGEKSKSFMTDKLMDALSTDLSDINEQLGEFRMQIEVMEEYLMKISGVIRRRA